ncbi:MAG: hypothetical protein ACI4QV_00745, partial [Acutalibacteraceae bacterium]
SIEFEIPADDTTIDWSQVNYVSIRTAKSFALRAEDAYSAIIMLHNVTLPVGTGYTAKAAEGSSSPVEHSGSYSFTVEILDKYKKGDNFAVTANGAVLSPQADGITYTISNITCNQTIEVTGVERADGLNVEGGDPEEIGSSYAYTYSPASGSSRKDGFYFDVDPAQNANMYGWESLYELDAWVYISDVSSYDIVIGLYTEGYFDNSVGSNYTEKWIYRYELMDSPYYYWQSTLKKGWNHLTVSIDNLKKGSMENTYTKEAYAAYASTKNIVGISFHENVAANYGNYTFAVANTVIKYIGGETYELIDPAAEKSVSDMNNTSANDVSANFSVQSVENLVITYVKESHVVSECKYSDNFAVIPCSGSSRAVEYGEDFSFNIAVPDGYSADNITVYANDTRLTRNADGSYTIKKVTENQEIFVYGVTADTVSGGNVGGYTEDNNGETLFYISGCEPDNAGGNGYYDDFGVECTDANDREYGHGSENVSFSDNCKQGSSSVRIDLPKEVDETSAKTRFVIRGINSKQLYTVKNPYCTYLQFWLYIDGFDNIDLRKSAVELSYVQDSEEYQIILADVDAYMRNHQGTGFEDNRWMLCSIPLSEANKNILSVKQFRLFLFSTTEAVSDTYVLIDDIKLVYGYDASGRGNTMLRDNVQWDFDSETGTLSLTGEGRTADFAEDSALLPWYDNISDIKKLNVSKGITYIGKNLFSGCTNLTEVCFEGKRSQWNSITVAEGNDLPKVTCLENEFGIEKACVETEDIIDNIAMTSDWSNFYCWYFSNHNALKTNKGGTLKYSFYGDEFDIVSYTSPSQGRLYVSIDGAEETMINLYSDGFDRDFRVTVFESGILDYEQHTVTIRAVGRAYIDSVNIRGELNKCDDHIAEYIKYEAEDISDKFSLSGNWSEKCAWNIFSNHKAMYCKGEGTLSFTYTGTGFYFSSYKSRTQGLIYVSIDGKRPTIINLYEDSVDTSYVSKIYNSGDIEYGTHTVVISNALAGFYFDSITIDGVFS